MERDKQKNLKQKPWRILCLVACFQVQVPLPISESLVPLAQGWHFLWWAGHSYINRNQGSTAQSLTGKSDGDISLVDKSLLLRMCQVNNQDQPSHLYSRFVTESTSSQPGIFKLLENRISYLIMP